MFESKTKEDEKSDWGERLQEKANQSKFEKPKSSNTESGTKGTSTIGMNKADLLGKLLNSPRVESISINIERVGAVEQTHINAKLKEIECLYMDTSKIDDEEMKKFKEALKNMPPSTINIFNNLEYQPSGDASEKLKPPSTGSGIK